MKKLGGGSKGEVRGWQVDEERRSRLNRELRGGKNGRRSFERLN